MKIKLIYLDHLIVFLLSFVLLVDSFNGYLKLSESSFVFPLSQLYKMLIIILILVRLYKKGMIFLLIFTLFLLLFFSSFVQLIKGANISYFEDVVKVIKYLTPIVCYFYFKEIFRFKNDRLKTKLFSFIKISYWIIVISILLKIVGLGYPLYPGNAGSKGYFYAGNEISGVLIITYAILIYELLKKDKIKSFWVFFVLTVYVAFTLGSKTAVFGIILITLMIKIRPLEILNSVRKMRKLVLLGSLFLPLSLFFLYKLVLGSDVFQTRIMFFYQKMDLVTLILSSRNVFLNNAFTAYLNEYNFIEKIIGVGQSEYENIVGKTVEIEFVDIFFTYGFLGFLMFLSLILLVFYKSYVIKSKPDYPYGRLTFLSLIILVIISSIAGHIFSSGMAGIFIGYIFAVQHQKEIN